MADRNFQEIPLEKLQLNAENDRHGPLDSQQDCIKWMLEHLRDEIYNLAKDIAERGLNAGDNIVVLPAEESTSGEFVVWEGNRRLTALRLLDNPDRCEDPNLAKKFRGIDKVVPIPSVVTCVVAESMEEADRVIESRHQGPQKGVGIVPWTGAQKSRHQTRLGKKARYAYTQDVVDSVAGKLDESLRIQVQDPKFPLSTLDRLLRNSEVREFLGLSDEDGKPRRVLHESETLKGLTKILKDLSHRKINVGDIYDGEKQRKYLEGFSKAETPDKNNSLKDSVPMEAPAKKQQTAVTPPVRPRTLPLSSERKKLIPVGVSYSIKDPRLNGIYRELKRNIDVQKCPNSVSVMLRVFLELSTELYLDHHGVTYQSFNDKLHQKVKKAVDHAVNQGWLEKATAKGIERETSNRNGLLGSDTLNAHVHSRHYHPKHSELNISWDNIQPYFDAILGHLD